jgi:hypothetical protein
MDPAGLKKDVEGSPDVRQPGLQEAEVEQRLSAGKAYDGSRLTGNRETNAERGQIGSRDRIPKLLAVE